MKPFFLLLFIIACTFVRAQNEFSYSDGNNNTYTLKKSVSTKTGETEYLATYSPVTPANSSSGIYSGGTPLETRISGTQFESVAQMITQLAKDSRQHVENRVMGSGMVVYSKKKKQKMYLLSPESGGKKELENKLRELMKSRQ